METSQREYPEGKGLLEIRGRELEFAPTTAPVSMADVLRGQLLRDDQYATDGMIEQFAWAIANKLALTSRLSQVLVERAQGQITPTVALFEVLLEGFWEALVNAKGARSAHEMLWELQATAVRVMRRELQTDAPPRGWVGEQRAPADPSPDPLHRLIQAEEVAVQRQAIDRLRALKLGRQQRRYLDAYAELIDVPKRDRHRAVCQLLRITPKAGWSLVRELRRKGKDAGIQLVF